MKGFFKMAIINLWNQRGQELDPTKTINQFILDRTKAKSGFIRGDVINDDIVAHMDAIASLHEENIGANVIHFTLEFGPTELTDPLAACRIAQQIVSYIEQEHQICFAVHEDRGNLHIHFVFNAFPYLGGHYYTGATTENLHLADYIARILCGFGIQLDGVFRTAGSKYSIEEHYKR